MKERTPYSRLSPVERLQVGILKATLVITTALPPESLPPHSTVQILREPKQPKPILNRRSPNENTRLFHYCKRKSP